MIKQFTCCPCSLVYTFGRCFCCHLSDSRAMCTILVENGKINVNYCLFCNINFFLYSTVLHRYGLLPFCVDTDSSSTVGYNFVNKATCFLFHLTMCGVYSFHTQLYRMEKYSALDRMLGKKTFFFFFCSNVPNTERKCACFVYKYAATWNEANETMEKCTHSHTVRAKGDKML